MKNRHLYREVANLERNPSTGSLTRIKVKSYGRRDLHKLGITNKSPSKRATKIP